MAASREVVPALLGVASRLWFNPHMQHTALGSTGMQVSRLCLGSMGFGWTASERESFSVMDAFADAGGNFIDTADVYSRWLPGHKGGEAETIIGRWMKQRGNRGEMVIATKVRGEMWPGPDGQGLSRQHIARAVEDSLRRLQTETIDLYQCHWFDDAVPIEETLRAMEDLIKAGKVRRIGLSNFPAPLIRAALNVSARHGLPRFETLQPHHSLVHRAEWEGELQQLCLAENFGVIPYSPLASGFLTGKYEPGAAKVSSQRANAVKQYFTPDGWRTLDAVRETAKSRGTSCSAVALAWQLAQPGITAPIVGANSPAQLAEQIPALSLELSKVELDALNAVSQPFLTPAPTGQ